MATSFYLRTIKEAPPVLIMLICGLSSVGFLLPFISIDKTSFPLTTEKRD